MFRKTIFWLHLTAGVITGVVVAMMSLTGVLLTYEHQFLQWDDRQYYQFARADSQRLDVERILESARSNNLKVAELSFSKDERMPVLASEGRRGKSTYISQYTGENLGPPGARYGEFFRTVTSWHRWFAAKGDARETGRLITGVSNLAFLFLVISGAYLWLPKIFRWPLLRARLLFSGSYQNAKVRDYHWHHIFGIWSAIPLLVVVSTAVVFSFSWASDLVSKLAGDAVAAPIEIRQSDFRQDPALGSESDAPGLGALLSIAKGLNEDWNTITLRVPEAGSDKIDFVVDPGTGHQVQRRETFTLSASTGAVVSASGFEHVPAGRRARIFIRFLHTGEVYGLAGQTIAGLVSLASLFLVWTGFAQAWRRLILKPIRKRARRKAI
jgi:uncharacterized iron-regulated membrane protein